MNRNVNMSSAFERLAPLTRKTICPLALSPSTDTPEMSPAEPPSPVASAYGGPLCDAADGTRISVATAPANRPRRLTVGTRAFIAVPSPCIPFRQVIPDYFGQTAKAVPDAARKAESSLHAQYLRSIDCVRVARTANPGPTAPAGPDSDCHEGPQPSARKVSTAAR